MPVKGIVMGTGMVEKSTECGMASIDMLPHVDMGMDG